MLSVQVRLFEPKNFEYCSIGRAKDLDALIHIFPFFIRHDYWAFYSKSYSRSGVIGNIPTSKLGVCGSNPQSNLVPWLTYAALAHLGRASHCQCEGDGIMARMLLQRGVVDTLIYPLGGLKPCMDAMCTLRKHQTRGEAIIRRRDGSLEIQIVKAGVLRSDTAEWTQSSSFRIIGFG